MINGDPYEFLDIVSTGQDIPYIYNGRKYWYQGYTKGKDFHMEIFRYDVEHEDYILNVVTTISKSIEIFENAPIFEGKTFWEVEKEIERLDDWTVKS